MDDDGDRCVYCQCPLESHEDTGCHECACRHIVFWDDDRGDE